MALKWMLCFEEPEARTLWLAKATPKDLNPLTKLCCREVAAHAARQADDSAITHWLSRRPSPVTPRSRDCHASAIFLMMRMITMKAHSSRST